MIVKTCTGGRNSCPPPLDGTVTSLIFARWQPTGYFSGRWHFTSAPRRQVAVCNLASIALNRFVSEDKSYNFAKLKEVTKVVTRNLNKIIDVNYYPVPEVSRGEGQG